MLKASSVLWDRVLFSAFVLLWGAGASAAELNTLKSVTVTRTANGAQVVVSGDRSPTFTVFRLSGPDRLVVDLSSADASAIKGHHEGQGPISGVLASQFSDEKASVGRLLLALEGASLYDVRADGNRIIVSVQGAAAAPSQVSEAPSAVPVQATGRPAAARSPQEARPAPGAENVVAAEADEREVARPARRITQVSLGSDALRILTDGEVAHYEVLQLEQPPRLALDVFGVELAARMPRSGSGPVREVRAGAHGDKVRLVLDVAGAMPAYEVVRREDGLELVLGARAERSGGSEKARTGAQVTLGGSPRVETAAVTPARSEAVAPVEVKDIVFTEAPGGGRLDIKLTGAARFSVERPDARSAVLTLENARLPKKLERSLDTSALETPVKMVSTFAVPGELPRVRVVVAAEGAIEQAAAAVAGGISWQLGVKGVKTEAVAVQSRTAGFTTEAATYALEGTPRQARYTGQRVTFEFKDIDIQNLLRVISEVAKKNIIVTDDVGGRVTIRLRNVPWDQALELILRSKGLGKEEFGNIIRVAPLTRLEEEARVRQARKEAAVKLEELQVQLLPVNYATAADMSPRVKEVLSERGSVTVDARTNVLIVKDIRAGIDRARGLVRNLDTPTPQVLIESRIVEANTTFSRSLGVQWGGSAQLAPGTGNATGLIFPNTVVVRGGSTNTGNLGTATTPNFAVNLPAPVGQGSGGALGFTFGSAGGALALNLRLSAAENEGVVKTISAPKVTTLDNNTARISQGISIPFSQVSAQGVNTVFVEAQLSLEVTPHITQDGSVLMNINATNNQPDPSNTGANGQPAIQRKEAQTQVLVKDGATTVIGGIYVRRGATATASVPFLSKIPVLGYFFRNETELDSRQELLIFITPRIINRQSIAQSL
jgi:type IV pilus assembly protein PilQ